MAETLLKRLLSPFLGTEAVERQLLQMNSINGGCCSVRWLGGIGSRQNSVVQFILAPVELLAPGCNSGCLATLWSARSHFGRILRLQAAYEVEEQVAMYLEFSDIKVFVYLKVFGH